MASISVALFGCGKPVPVGTFVGHRNGLGQPGTDPVVVAQLNRIILRIDADGKANLEDGGLPWEGRIARSGDTLDFDVDAIAGVGMSKQPSELSRKIQFRIASDDEIDFGGVKLERKATL